MAYQYRVGQVCMNGHIITSNIQDGDGSNFCAQCGEPTITSCEACGAALRGSGHDSEWGSYIPMRTAPAFCYNCGGPFPWTERAVAAAKELADEIEDIDESEREKAKASFIALASDTPQTTVAATRVKRLIARAGPIIGAGIRDIVVSIATEAAKKQMGL